MQNDYIDDIDEMILEALEKNARINHSQLGRMLGRSHTTIHKRIKRLEQLGLIPGYTLREDDKTDVIRSMAIVDVLPDAVQRVGDALEKERWALMVVRFQKRILVFSTIGSSKDMEMLMRPVTDSAKGVIDYTVTL